MVLVGGVILLLVGVAAEVAAAEVEEVTLGVLKEGVAITNSSSLSSSTSSVIANPCRTEWGVVITSTLTFTSMLSEDSMLFMLLLPLDLFFVNGV